MSLRPFLAHLERHPDAARLSEPGARAFVSQSLRPYLIAALADRDARRPTVVVAGDDRAARDLAADLRAWLRPRAVRFYPSRGVAYESHLTPPAHLVGLRVAALDALLDRSPGTEAPVVVVSAVALSEKVPDPALRPHGFTLAGRRAARPRRVRERPRRRRLRARRPGRGPRPVRRPRRAARRLPGDRGAGDPRRPVRRRDRVAALVLDVHAALARRRPTWSRSRPRPSSPPSTASSPRSRRSRAPDERPDIAELLPVDDFRDLLDLIPDEAELVLSAEEDVEPALRDHWDDVCAAFHDTDAHHLYVKPDGILAALEARAAAAALLDLGLPAARVPRPGRRVRRALAARGRAGAGEAHPLRLHDARHLAEPRRRRARRVQPRARQGALGRDGRGPRLPGGQPARRLRRARPNARRDPRAPADPPAQGRRRARRAGAAACCAPSPTCARATTSCTRTTASRASPASTPRPSAASRATT